MKMRIKTRLVSAPIVIAVFILSMSQYQSLMEIQWWKTVREEKEKGFDRVLLYEPEKPIIAFSSFYSPLIQTLDPKSNKVDQIFHKIVYINWAQRSPDYDKHLLDLKINENLFTEIAFGNAYLGTSNLEELQMVNQYLIEHHGIEPIWDVAPFIYSDTGLGIWKIIGLK